MGIGDEEDAETEVALAMEGDDEEMVAVLIKTVETEEMAAVLKTVGIEDGKAQAALEVLPQTEGDEKGIKAQTILEKERNEDVRQAKVYRKGLKVALEAIDTNRNEVSQNIKILQIARKSTSETSTYMWLFLQPDVWT